MSRLLDLLRRETANPALAYERQPEPLTGGFWAELLTFSLADPPRGWPKDLVARLMPDPLMARKETIVQTAIAATGFPTPVVRVSGDPDAGLGRAFMVMDRAPGAPILTGLNGPSAVTTALPQLKAIPKVLATAMAKLHALDSAAIRTDLRSLSGIPISVDDLVNSLRHAANEYQRPDLAGVASWLVTHRSRIGSDVICHGDLHPFNLLVDEDKVTVLDWSAALIGPPAYDIAFTTTMLSEPPIVVPRPIRPLISGVGRRLAKKFLQHYQCEVRAALDGDELRWHQTLVCLRALVEVAGWVHFGVIEKRTGHPWLITEPALTARIADATGIHVQSR